MIGRGKKKNRTLQDVLSRTVSDMNDFGGICKFQVGQGTLLYVPMPRTDGAQQGVLRVGSCTNSAIIIKVWPWASRSLSQGLNHSVIRLLGQDLLFHIPLYCYGMDTIPLSMSKYIANCKHYDTIAIGFCDSNTAFLIPSQPFQHYFQS